MEETWKMLWRFAEDHDLRGAYGENITFEIETCDDEKEHLELAKKRGWVLYEESDGTYEVELQTEDFCAGRTCVKDHKFLLFIEEELEELVSFFEGSDCE